MAKVPKANPNAIRLVGVIFNPTFLRVGKMSISNMGMKIMRVNGSMFDRRSFGMPCVSIVAAWDVKLLLIWL